MAEYSSNVWSSVSRLGKLGVVLNATSISRAYSAGDGCLISGDSIISSDGGSVQLFTDYRQPLRAGCRADTEYERREAQETWLAPTMASSCRQEWLCGLHGVGTGACTNWPQAAGPNGAHIRASTCNGDVSWPASRTPRAGSSQERCPPRQPRGELGAASRKPRQWCYSLSSLRNASVAVAAERAWRESGFRQWGTAGRCGLA